MAFVVNQFEDDEGNPFEVTTGAVIDWANENLPKIGIRAIRFAEIEDAAKYLNRFNGQNFGGIVEFDDGFYGVYVGDTNGNET